MALRIEIWSDDPELDIWTDVSIEIEDREDNKYKYSYEINVRGDQVDGDGELHSINPIYPLELPQMILTSILSTYRKAKDGRNVSR